MELQLYFAPRGTFILVSRKNHGPELIFCFISKRSYTKKSHNKITVLEVLEK